MLYHRTEERLLTVCLSHGDSPTFASNPPFFLVAIWGLRALRSPTSFQEYWEWNAYSLLIAAVALISVGSSYYHLWPSDRTLFWDRLPMTIVFMSLLATTIGERISMNAGQLLLLPLITTGVASVLYWRFSGDLRLYLVVQFLPLITLPFILSLLRPVYSGTAGIIGMVGLYGVAKVLEALDRQIGGTLPTGGHLWKHLAGALAMLCYVNTVRQRRWLGIPISGKS